MPFSNIIGLPNTPIQLQPVQYPKVGPHDFEPEGGYKGMLEGFAKAFEGVNKAIENMSPEKRAEHLYKMEMRNIMMKNIQGYKLHPEKYTLTASGPMPKDPNEVQMDGIRMRNASLDVADKERKAKAYEAQDNEEARRRKQFNDLKTKSDAEDKNAQPPTTTPAKETLPPLKAPGGEDLKLQVKPPSLKGMPPATPSSGPQVVTPTEPKQASTETTNTFKSPEDEAQYRKEVEDAQKQYGAGGQTAMAATGNEDFILNPFESKVETSPTGLMPLNQAA